MNKIFFVTTNSGKFQQVQKWLQELAPEIELEQMALDIPEYQTFDINEVAIGKAKHAWSLVQKPLLIDDGGVLLDAYKNFPGAFSKQIFQCLGLEGFWKLAQDNPRGCFLNTLVYIDGPDSYKLFQGKTEGTFIEPQRPAENLNLPYTEIFIPDGSSKTFAQIAKTENNKSLYHRRKL